MTLINLDKAPFPYAGGKRAATPFIWQALGDVGHYVEPFAGSLANLLCRPHLANRPYFSETVNDLDGLLINAWRAIQLQPDATAEAASWPVSEVDQAARQWACVRWVKDRDVEKMMVDPLWCDPVIAGYWLYGMGTWIGFGFADGKGAWVEQDGRLVKMPKPKREPGIGQQRPHLTSNGQGVHRPQMREPGIGQQLPHLHDNGQGVHRPQMREPGIGQQRPHLTSDGQGVHRPQMREPGIGQQLPHLHDNGRGVHHAGTREPGIGQKLPHLHDNGRGVHRPQMREPGIVSMYDPDWQFHPVTMPELRRWFGALSARLRHVRICCGDYKRVLTPSASITLSCDKRNPCGVFIDPPYADSAGRDMGLYSKDSGDVAHEARAWAIKNGNNPLYRIVFAGYKGEHGVTFADAGWREIEWFTNGFLTGGYGNQGDDGHQQDREQLWASPHCLQPDTAAAATMNMWEDEE